MKSLWNHLTDIFVEVRVSRGSTKAALKFCQALGALWFREQHRQLLRVQLFQKYIAAPGATDVLSHLSHRYYLSTLLTYRQRIENALLHYRYEEDRYDDSYKDRVYSGAGLTLWSTRIDANRFAIRLRASNDQRHEGCISVVLSVNERDLCQMAFAWVDAAVFGEDWGVVPFITRNQSTGPSALELTQFRQAFPQNSPQHACLAAMRGVTRAHCGSRLLGISHECQIVFDERRAVSFRNSYCALWESFGAVRLGRQAHVMPVPTCLMPLSELQSRHRKRARARRELWSTIEVDSAAAIRCRLKQGAVWRPKGIAPDPLHMSDAQSRSQTQ
jgi:hypothetical protein